ncbi:MAG: hypothetical protein KAT70_01500 [Thermoplasmata archaeon]|nr:hypothetical protein [Thermoplasmata archaeon]
MEQNNGAKPLFQARKGLSLKVVSIMFTAFGTTLYSLVLLKVPTTGDRMFTYGFSVISGTLFFSLGILGLYSLFKGKDLRIYSDHIMIPIGFLSTTEKRIPFSDIGCLYLNKYSPANIPYSYMIMSLSNGEKIEITRDDLRHRGYSLLMKQMHTNNITVLDQTNWIRGRGEMPAIPPKRRGR